MKKVKIMLLSLALFAVVGGALAFKVKFGDKLYCTTDAYFDSAEDPQFYCSFDNGGSVITKDCPDLPVTGTFPGSGNLVVCTTTPINEGTDCPVDCPLITRWIDNQ